MSLSPSAPARAQAGLPSWNLPLDADVYKDNEGMLHISSFSCNIISDFLCWSAGTGTGQELRSSPWGSPGATQAWAGISPVGAELGWRDPGVPQPPVTL